MDLRAVLRAFGLGGAVGQVQPDVSGATIANLLRQTGGDRDLMIPALGSFYEEVIVSEPGPRLLHLDLWRDGQPFAAILCDDTGPRRCTFRYWDPEAEVNAFLQQASVWADAQVAPLRETQGPDGMRMWTATGDALTVSLARPVSGDEAEALLDMVFGE